MDKGEKNGLFYGWVVVVACFLAAFGYGIFYTIGVFFKPLQEEFGWSYTLTSSIQSLHMTVFILSTFLVGWSTDKFGPRLTILWGGILVAVGTGLCSQVNTIGQFFLFYGLASLGSGISVWSLITPTVQRWFIKRRGLTLGITISGIGAGTMVYVPIVNYLILAQGWRMSYIIAAIATFVILMIAATLIRKSPEEKGLKPYGTDEVVAQPDANEAEEGKLKLEQAKEWTLKQALKTKTFWLPSIIYFCSLLSICMVMVHIVPAAINAGIDKTAAAGALGLVGAASTAGKAVMGTSADRLGWERGIIICCGMCCIMFLWFPGVKSLWMLYIFAIVYGFFSAGVVPLVPGLLGSYFPGKSLATIIGGSHAFCSIGGAIGPLIGGIVFDLTRSYATAFIIGAILWAIATALTFLIMRQKRAALPHQPSLASLN